MISVISRSNFRNILRHFNTTTPMREAVKTFGTEFSKFYHKGSFSKKHKLLKKFQVL